MPPSLSSGLMAHLLHCLCRASISLTSSRGRALTHLCTFILFINARSLGISSHLTALSNSCQLTTPKLTSPAQIPPTMSTVDASISGGEIIKHKMQLRVLPKFTQRSGSEKHKGKTTSGCACVSSLCPRPKSLTQH